MRSGHTTAERECPHRTPPRLPYMASHADARRRMKRKESQRKCPVCGLWIWGEYWNLDVGRCRMVRGRPVHNGSNRSGSK